MLIISPHWAVNQGRSGAGIGMLDSSRGHCNSKTRSVPAWEEGPLRLNKSDILCEDGRGCSYCAGLAGHKDHLASR